MEQFVKQWLCVDLQTITQLRQQLKTVVVA